MRQIATTILDFVAVCAVITGAFLIGLGAGLVACGVCVAAMSIAITKNAPREKAPTAQ
jgi:hypothetical protein